VADESLKNYPKLWKWRLEWLAQTGLEKCVGLLSGPAAFRLGEILGGLAWHFMRGRRIIVLRNLRIAFYGEYDLPTLEKMVHESFRRTGANLLSAAHTAQIPREEIGKILTIENPGLIEPAVAGGKGLVLMPPHMGNWEVLTRLNDFFPPGHPSGALYRPLNNPFLDQQLLAQREADGTKLFSKRDSFHVITSFIRDAGIVGILADQRSGRLGELTRFFGRITRASPLPSLLARRSKSQVFAMSVTTTEPGKWKIRYHPVEGQINTTNCMKALEMAMKASPLDVFWFQERWKLYLNPQEPLTDWLDTESHGEGTPHRALLWLPGVPNGWQIPESWTHPDVIYETIHQIDATGDVSLGKFLADIDRASLLPVDFILTCNATNALIKAARREGIPLISLKA
jgi:KDO2-lipid IV(A) lauroyltransferase